MMFQYRYQLAYERLKECATKRGIQIVELRGEPLETLSWMDGQKFISVKYGRWPHHRARSLARHVGYHVRGQVKSFDT